LYRYSLAFEAAVDKICNKFEILVNRISYLCDFISIHACKAAAVALFAHFKYIILFSMNALFKILDCRLKIEYGKEIS